MDVINLQEFCLNNEFGLRVVRKWQQQPFSIGDYSYATDSAILIRVPRQMEFPELLEPLQSETRPSPKKIEKIVEGTLSIPKHYESLPSFTFPQEDTTAVCDVCAGLGVSVHFNDEGPANSWSTCGFCAGTGHVETYPVDIFGRSFALRYVRKIIALPNVTAALAEVPAGHPVLAFCFDGGEGTLMALRGKAPTTH
jgi:hypothetical protein